MFDSEELAETAELLSWGSPWPLWECHWNYSVSTASSAYTPLRGKIDRAHRSRKEGKSPQGAGAKLLRLAAHRTHARKYSRSEKGKAARRMKRVNMTEAQREHERACVRRRRALKRRVTVNK